MMIGIERKLLVTIFTLLLAGCDLRESETLAPPAEPAGGRTAPTTDVQAEDPEASARLQAGQAWLSANILASASPYQVVALQPDFRYLLHPGDDASATMQINVSGIASLILEPVIESFQGNPDCTGNPDAGVVDLAYSLDGGEPIVVTVDRHFRERITVDTTGKRVLDLVVSKGNGVIWCDWFAVGVSDVTPGTVD